MKRAASDPVCWWCKRKLTTYPRNKTTGDYALLPGLPAGVGVVVCNDKCPKRPEGAPVGARFGS